MGDVCLPASAVTSSRWKELEVSVADQLGVDDVDGELLGAARALWPCWVAELPVLGVAASLAELRPWLQAADPVSADRVLHGLARLGSPSGGGSVAAAGVLAWALLPGACSLAGRLATLSPRIDELVAAQLWIEVRAFPWQRLTKVSSNILMNTRSRVLRDLGAFHQLSKSDRTWSLTVVADPHSPVWEGHYGSGPTRGSSPAQQDPTSADELLELLEWACRDDVISEADRSLLLALLEVADRSGSRRLRRGRGGLMGNEVSELVAEQWGIGSSTVRRRVRHTVQALTAACAEGRFAA